MHIFEVWIVKWLIWSNIHIHIHVGIHHIIWSLHSHHRPELIRLLGLHIKNRCQILIFVFISSFIAKFLFLPDPVAEVNAEGYYSDLSYWGLGWDLACLAVEHSSYVERSSSDY